MEVGMGHEWMIRTIEDLEDYARRNDLPALAAQLEQARYLAWTECAGRDLYQPLGQAAQ
jgi:hypothetical protein